MTMLNAEANARLSFLESHMRCSQLSRAILATAFVVLTGGLALAGSSFPAFRGDGAGQVQAKNLPLEWSPKTVTHVIDTPGYGQSSPVVHNGKVFLTSVDGPNKETCLVLAYDAVTGKPAWKKELAASQTVKSSVFVSRAAPTPVVDDKALYVFFESGELAALDLKDGAELWKRSLTKEYGEFKNGHGLGGSPAATANALFVLVDHQGPSYLLAVDKKTGKNLWKEERKSRSSWTSPVVTRNKAGKEWLVISSGGSVDVYDCVSGKQLSSYTDVGNNNVPSAVVAGNRVVVGASDPPKQANRELTLKSCCCIQLSDDGKLAEKSDWQSEKATASFASPLVHQECVYYINTTGVVACLDLKTGKEQYTTRLNAGAWASPIAAGERVYFFDKSGGTTVLKAGAKLEKLATNRLWTAADSTEGGGGKMMFGGPTVYGAAVVDGAIFARTGNKLYIVRAK